LSLIRIALCLLSFFVSLLCEANTFTVQKRWHNIGGSVRSLSVASDGHVAAVDANDRLKAWSVANHSWKSLPYKGARVLALPDGHYYAVGQDQQLIYFNGRQHQPVGIRVLDVAVSGDGSVYAIRADGALIHKAVKKDKWELLAMVGGRRIVVAPDNSLWLMLANAGVPEGGTIAHWIGAKLEHIPGKALDIAVGSDGAVFAVSSDGLLYKRLEANSKWIKEKAPANLVAIAIGPQGNPWVANAAGVVFTQAVIDSGKADYVGAIEAKKVSDLSPITWMNTKASAASLTIASDGSVFALGSDNSITRWSNKQKRFLSYPGQFAKMAAGVNGNIWGLDASGKILRRDGSVWTQVVGVASDIAIGGDGQVYANTSWGRLLKYDPASDSMQFAHAFMHSVAVAPDGVPWGLAKDGVVMRCPTKTCQQFKLRAKSLSIGPDGSVFAITFGGALKRLQEKQTQWDNIPLPSKKVTAVAVGPNGLPWVVAGNGHVYAASYFPRDESADQSEAAATSSQTTGSQAIAATKTGFSFLKNAAFQKIRIPAGANRISTGQDGSVVMFIGSTRLISYDRKRNSFAEITGLPSHWPSHQIKNITDAKYAPDGKLWILGADKDGMVEYQVSGSTYKKIFLPIKRQTTPVNGLNRSLAIAPDGTVYVVTTKGYIYVRPVGESAVSRIPQFGHPVKKLVVARSGELWMIGTDGFVYEIVNGKALPPGGKWFKGTDIAAGRDGSVYITTDLWGKNHPAKWNAANKTWDKYKVVADSIGIDGDGKLWLYENAKPNQVLREK